MFLYLKISYRYDISTKTEVLYIFIENVQMISSF